MSPEAKALNQVVKILDTNQLIELEPTEFDERLLDHAKEHHLDPKISRLRTSDGYAWILRKFEYRGIEFVQMQSPNGKLRYYLQRVASGEQPGARIPNQSSPRPRVQDHELELAMETTLRTGRMSFKDYTVLENAYLGWWVRAVLRETCR